MTLLLWLACGGADLAGERETYRELVADREPDAARDLPRCAGLTDPDLAGDCGLTVAQRAGVAADDPGGFCDRVAGEIWQEECWFQAAEHRRKQGRIADALDLCARSGRFRERCDYHLWQEDSRRAVEGLRSDAAALAVQRASEAYGSWSARVGPDWSPPADLPLGAAPPEPTFEATWWTRVFQQLFEPDETLDITRCNAVDAELLRFCEAGVYDVLRRRALDWQRFRQGTCDTLPAEVGEASAWWNERGVYFVADERVVRELAKTCAGEP